ncbi:MAG: dihydroorotate dehydrogenase-like protein [Bacteroidales bacterium]|jgi:dihydroorotate dehydrogenase (fumarate)|nr:dihydroorotate dehydrogenase-like protein [Bacteroidales bacterium]
MTNTGCKYMGLSLKSPIIVGSCGLTNSIEKMKKMEEYGAGAIVLKSIFEEQITNEVMQSMDNTNFDVSYRDAFDYIKGYTQMASYEKYGNIIREAKKNLSIPVIASINCSSDGDWVSYAKRIEDAGADALELNIFFLPADFNKLGAVNEDIYFKIIEHIKANVNIAVALKTGYYFSGLAKMLQSLSYTGINSLVLFNRFFAPDIDVENMHIKAAPIFKEGEGFYNTLRWIAIMYNHVNCDLSATSGITNGKDVVKQLLAGADTVQIATVLYNKGIEHIQTILNELTEWMEKHHYASIDEFKGKMSFDNINNPDAYLRIQFMKYFSGIE